MARGIIGKAIRGAASAGVPMLIEQEKNNQLAKREKVLMEIQQQYKAQDRAADQAFTAGQNQLDRDQRATEFQAGREDSRAQLDMQRDELGMRREQLDLTAQQIQQTMEAGNLGIIEQKRLQGLYDIIANPQAEDAEITRAITVLNGLKGQNPDKYQAITLYGDDVDANGNQLRTSGILNTGTGDITPAPMGNRSSGSSSGAIPGNYATPQTDAEFEALPSGSIYIDPEDGLTYRKP